MLNKGEIVKALIERGYEIGAENHFVTTGDLYKPAAEMLRNSVIDTHEIAGKALVKKVVRDMRPKFKNGQLEFFEQSPWIKVAKSVLVVLDHATQEDVLAWKKYECGKTDRIIVANNIAKGFMELVLPLFSPGLITFADVRKTYPNFQKEHSVYLSLEWFALRDSVLADANYVCVDCQGTAETAHHTTYAHGIICDKRFLVALCWPCHRKRHPDKGE